MSGPIASHECADAEAVYGVAYAEAVRALGTQRDLFESVRTRTGFVFSVGAITTSFLGAQAFDSGPAASIAWIALGLFVLACGAALAVLWPLEWDGTMDADALLADYVDADQPASAAELHRDLALHIETGYRRNERIKVKVTMAFRTACMLFSFETLAWVIDLGA
jgi:hypothetical protein